MADNGSTTTGYTTIITTRGTRKRAEEYEFECCVRALETMEDETTQHAVIAQLHSLQNSVQDVLRAVNAKQLPSASNADALSFLQQAHLSLLGLSRLFKTVSVGLHVYESNVCV